MLMMYLNLVDTPEEKSKFKQLYDKYRNLMFFCAKEILKDDGLAQDAVQEALIKLTKYLKKINEVDCHKTKHFIVIIVESASKDIYRREKRQKSISWEEIGENYDFPQAERVEAVSELTDVERAIMELPGEYRKIFRMKYVWGYSNQEIGELLGIRQSALRQRIARGKKILQDILDEMEVDTHG